MNPRPAPQCDYQRSVLSAVADGAGNAGTNQGAPRDVSQHASLDALRSQWPTMVELAIQLFPGIDVYFAHAGNFFESFVFLTSLSLAQEISTGHMSMFSHSKQNTLNKPIVKNNENQG